MNSDTTHRAMPKAAGPDDLRRSLELLKLPFILDHVEDFARQAGAEQWSHMEFLVRLIEGEAALHQERACQRRVTQARFPVLKTFEQFDFTWPTKINRLAVQNLFRLKFIEDKANAILIGGVGLGKTHLAIALGLAACRLGKRVRFFTAATLVNRLEETQKQYQLERFLKQLDKLDLLVCDELGYLSFNRSGAELLFQVFADRYERSSLLITSNLPFSEWQQVFQGERMTAALLDRLTHHCEIFEMNGESYRFRESMKQKRTTKGK